MLTFTHAYNQTRLIPDTINRRIHTYSMYILCFFSSFLIIYFYFI